VDLREVLEHRRKGLEKYIIPDIFPDTPRVENQWGSLRYS
jgi:hypothetical protein